MTTIRDILAKDIARPIDGVIKADDERHLLQEVEEYVITREIEKELRRLVEALKESINSRAEYPYNGVWISGYFGSGKSHLLKILAFLMADKQVDGIKLRDLFLKKIDDALFRADFEKVLSIPSTNVLFNIEQHAEAAKLKNEHAMLYAFIRMFNFIQGYYQEPGAVSSFERHLEEENKLASWKEFYRSRTGKSWEEQRPKALLLGRKKFMEVLSEFWQISQEEASQIIAQYEEQHSVTVDEFCNEVVRWLRQQADKRHRINFFVDEVGQFVAQDPKLMLSLQTIVEALGVKTGGRAWVYVTSQEAIDSLVGGYKKSLSTMDSFSKIMGRFKFRIALSSADVREVIQKRLLEKNQKGKELLRDYYHKTKEDIRIVFTFMEGAKLSQFKDEESFVYSYPFPAYQYDLLQDTLRGFGEHSAFIGAHVSVGERSMLEIFQEVGKVCRNKELFYFAPFDTMFDGIRPTLNTGLIAAINQAEHNIHDPFVVRVLKVLLLVKYIQGFRSTVNNLKVLLTDRVDTDMSQLSQKVQEALTQLERQTYIRRNGDLYEYLTNDEKDVEEEIRQLHVDIQDFRKFIEGIVFGDILKGNKIRHEGTGEDYVFKKALDDGSGKGQGDLLIRVITPWHPFGTDRKAFLNHSTALKELLVMLPPDSNFMGELELYLKTEAWLHHTDGRQTKYARIYADKQAQLNENKRRLSDKVKELVKQADFAAMDQEISIPQGTPLERIERAFQELISRSYHHLKMLKIHYTQETLRKILFEGNSLFDKDSTERGEAENELYNWLRIKHKNAESVTLIKIKDEFGKGQYGWYEWAILCVVANLFMRQEIELIRNSEVLGREEVFNLLNQNRGHDTIIVKPAPEITQQEIQQLKELHLALFHVDSTGTNGKEVAIGFKKALFDFKQKFGESLRGAPDFPFLQKAQELDLSLDLYLKKDWAWFLEAIPSYRMELENLVEEASQIMTFLNGPNVLTWRSIDNWFRENRENVNEIGMPEAVKAIHAYRSSPDLFKTSNTKRAKDLWESLKHKEKELLAQERKNASSRIDEIFSTLQALSGWNELNAAQQKEFQNNFEHLKGTLTQKDTLPAVRDIGVTQVQKLFELCRKRINEILHPTEKIIYASGEEKRVPFPKAELVTEADVEDYVRSLSKHWKSLISQGKRIILS